VLVGITSGAGVTLAHPIQVEGSLKGHHYAHYISGDKVFENGITKSPRPSSRQILQDNCPVQTSKLAEKAFAKERIGTFDIPARSPDLNPIENLFAQMKQRLRLQARNNNIIKETLKQFTDRVVDTLVSFDKRKIDKLIDSMPKRIDDVIKSRGGRINY
jgi:hypothetical protein